MIDREVWKEWRKGSVDEFFDDIQWSEAELRERACNRGLGCLFGIVFSCLFWAVVALVMWGLM